jgi:cholesterol transport system auxiliary component
MRTIKLLAVLAVMTALWGCGHVPQTHYYMFDYDSPRVDSHVPQKATLGVSRVNINAPYDQDRLVYRRRPNEVEFYHYHRWVNPPAELVRQRLTTDLTASGLFDEVVLFPENHEVDYVLRARITRLEEWDEADRWIACLNLHVEIVNMRGGELLLATDFKEQQPVGEQTPAGVVEGLNACLKRCAEGLLAQLSEVLLTR